MLEADFSISCAQCGGQEFQEVFPVPAETYCLYEGKGGSQPPRRLHAVVYACLQCGHLEKFLDLEGAPPPEEEQ